MRSEELSAREAHFSYDIDRIARLREGCKKVSIIGQPRAMSALEMGMNVNAKGYNIYLSGEDGTGRHTAVREIARKISSKRPVLDLLYAYNFKRPQSPFLISLPASCGWRFDFAMKKVSAFVSDKRWDEALSSLASLSEIREAVGANALFEQYLAQVSEALRARVSEPEKYLVNLICDNQGKEDCPFVEEYHPTHINLFGQIGKTDGSGDYAHLSLTSGSILDAAGGFFVVRADKVLSQEGLWDSLKLYAESSSFIIRKADGKDASFIRPVTSFVPTKIILIGSDELYDKLCETDDEFLRLFKVSAEFDFAMPASDENISGTIAYLLDITAKNNLKPVNNAAICELLVYSSWYAEMRDELTTKLSFLGDLLSEANYIADRKGLSEIDASCVRTAMEERDFANGLTEDRINQEIKNGEMVISLEGTKVGVLNGLAVMDRGLASFGTPTVISVSVAPGSEGIVNIEHEAGLSGEIHDKGLLILEGYLRKQYARTFPLSVYAGICFEQSYAEVDGDSASSAELFALLSAIGEIPVRQDIAVTGSVNQLGDIQPVGGINEKIEGFFAICEIMGLTGHQGVIIPRQNIKTLILTDKVLKAIEQHKFHIYPISTIDEGMEILTLRQSGIRNVKGNFPPDTINHIIENRLKKLYELSKPN
ncbi:MAG: AAA family ATPase [Spirochaetales bacterium]|nr:AAA family ATPase [Spirochaetales bacterium]MBO6048553.1 AAA family ATPase [Spirochaetales bacterium]MBO7349839.1 AAA family ATPase [Spirochaetales bacterium]